MSGTDVATLRPALAHPRHHGRAIVRQTLIAAAIAAGLVGLWALLLTIVT